MIQEIRQLLDLSDRGVLVTGGGGGIGRATCRLLRDVGATVFSADLRSPGEEEGIQDFEVDIGDSPAVESLVSGIAGELDAIVHCAGIARDGVLWKMPDEDWSQVMKVNLDSAFYLLRSAVPHLRKRGGGSVVLVSSINGERGKFGQANYTAAKAGLIGLMRTSAREVGAFGIRVNAISPGLIETPMTEGLAEIQRQKAREDSVLGRLGTPEDVARAILFLVSPLSRHVTGQVLRVDGGQLIG